MLMNEDCFVALDERELRSAASYGEMDGPMKSPVSMVKYIAGKAIYEDEEGGLFFTLEDKQAFRFGLTEEKEVVDGLQPFDMLSENEQKEFAALLELDQPELKVVAFGEEAGEVIGVMTETRESPFTIKTEVLERLTEEQKAVLKQHSADRDLTCPFAIQIQKDPDAFVMY